MAKTAARSRTPNAAQPAAEPDARDVEVLSRLMELGLEMAEVFQAQAIAAAKAGEDDKAAAAEAGFNRTALGVRRAVALKARLRQQRDEAARAADWRRDRRREEADSRRRAVAQGIGHAIAAQPDANTRERLTADLWSRLVEDERIDADRADTVLPIETLILRLGRELGLPHHVLAAGLGPEGKVRPERPRTQRRGPAIEAAGDGAAGLDPLEPPVTGFEYYRGVAASDFGGPEGECWTHCVTSGEVFDENDNVVMMLPVPDEPWRDRPPDAWAPAAAAPAMAAPPATEPEPPPDEDPAKAEHRRRQAEARRFGLTLPDL